MSNSIVTETKFNELVNSTTQYLQDLLDRVQKLEAQVAALKSKKGKADGE